MCRLDREKFKEVDWTMSNFDGEVPIGMEDVLKVNEVYVRHAGRDFNGSVWFEDNIFHEEVWVHGAYIETTSAKTLRGLMEKVNDFYGWE